MGNVSGERKTCTSENSLQKLSKKTQQKQMPENWKQHNIN